MWQKLPRLILGGLLLAPLGCGQASGDQPSPIPYPFILSPDEIGLAREMAEKDWHAAEHPASFKTLFIKVDLLPESQAETNQRLVMVHHYQYSGDRTILTMIDLHSRQILKREILDHYPTALAPTEIEQATRLARADPRLKPILDLLPTHFDARPIQYAAAGEPLFGHRVVHLLMRHDRNYLVNPQVYVDLTTETVSLETNTPNQN
jgi:hypothetical protein